MCISVCWDNNEQTALRIQYAKRWNWRDHGLALDTVNTLLNTVAHKVDLIVDLQESGPLPQTMMIEVARSPQALHPNWSGAVVIITADRDLARLILEVTPGFRAGCRAAADVIQPEGAAVAR